MRYVAPPPRRLLRQHPLGVVQVTTVFREIDFLDVTAIFRRLDQYPAGAARWQAAAESLPASPEPLLGLAEMRRRVGDREGALVAARAAEGRRTCEGAGALAVSTILQESGMEAAAILHLEELSARCPDSRAIAGRLASIRSQGNLPVP